MLRYLLLVMMLHVSHVYASQTTATAQVSATSEASNVSGVVEFIQTPQGVEVIANISGLTPNGKHGFHVHENGSCEDVGKAAGGHYNPHGVDHGFLPQDGHEHAHLGDMGNLEADNQGVAQLKILMPVLTLTQDPNNGILNRSIIIHEKADDFGQPLGNAGGRIGCGIIALNNE